MGKPKGERRDLGRRRRVRSETGEMSGGWGCPHEDRGRCTRRGAPCEAGAEGCVLEAAFRKGGGPDDG
ncbi:MAG: hypothetical protein Kow0054_20440 [Deferrisoma sp.]